MSSHTGRTETATAPARREEPPTTGTASPDERGRAAERPSAIPGAGWGDIAARVRRKFRTDHVTLTSAGVAFFGFTALVPLLAAGVAVYGLIADESDVLRLTDRIDGAVPPQVADMITQQLQAVVGAAPNTLGLATAIGIAAGLWTASSGIAHLIEAVNIAFDEDVDERSFWRKRGLALLFTFGLLALFATSGVVIVVGSRLGDGLAGLVGEIASWIIVGLLAAAALATLYRYGPDRADPRWRWVAPGALLAIVAGVVLSVGFRFYVANFGSYNETYGSLGAVIVVLLWLYLTAMSVIVGAEVDAEVEHQTSVDTTTESDRPMGRRDAQMADTLGRPNR